MARVLVMGAGGVGGYYGAVLASAGHDVVFVARGPNLETLRTSGMRVTGAREQITLSAVAATDDPASAGEQDLVLMCVKAYDLEEAAELCAPCGGVVLTLQNGVDAAERVNAVQGRDAALAGATGIVADLREPGHVVCVSSYAWIRFGEPSGVPSERVERVERWLHVGGVTEAEACADVRPSLWAKMATICGQAGLTTLWQRPLGPILADPHGRATFRRIVEEVAAVGRATGVPLPDGFVDDRMDYADGIDPRATSSMARDFRRGKPIEIDQITGTIVRLGAEHGIDVPVNETVYGGIRLHPRPGEAPEGL